MTKLDDVARAIMGVMHGYVPMDTEVEAAARAAIAAHLAALREEGWMISRYKTVNGEVTVEIYDAEKDD